MSSRAPAQPRRTVHVQRVMGTTVSFDLREQGDHTAAIDAATRWFAEVDRRFSPYRGDSEVSRLGRGELAAADQSADLREIVAACEAMADRSGGAFAARRGGGFDPSAFVKGWSVDRAARILRDHGCEDWSMNAGGDVLVASRWKPTPWRVGVQHPFDRSALGMLLQAEDLAVATSGRYERGDHVVDPRTGLPATGAASVTVCGPSLGEADALATAAFVLGADGPDWLAEQPGSESWTVLDDGRVVATDGFPRLLHGMPVGLAPFRDPAVAA